MDYQSMQYADIKKWCIANGEAEWLLGMLEKKVEHKKYPRIKIINEKGKKVSVADKSKEPTIVMGNVTFVQLKMAFVEKFMPSIAPKKKDTEPTMFDDIAELKALLK